MKIFPTGFVPDPVQGFGSDPQNKNPKLILYGFHSSKISKIEIKQEHLN